MAPTPIGPVLSLDPPMVNQPTGGTFALNVILNGGQNVFSVPVQISYDPKVMQFVSVSNAGALSKDGAAVALVHRDDAAKGTRADIADETAGIDRHYSLGTDVYDDVRGQGGRAGNDLSGQDGTAGSEYGGD